MKFPIQLPKILIYNPCTAVPKNVVLRIFNIFTIEFTSPVVIVPDNPEIEFSPVTALESTLFSNVALLEAERDIPHVSQFRDWEVDKSGSTIFPLRLPKIFIDIMCIFEFITVKFTLFKRDTKE